ncbi:MAG: GNAT family N-acetyltransferase [Anaerolineales bacterium]|nr:GNAT family N-acetyltransferase [Anaerolineales bacterium]
MKIKIINDFPQLETLKEPWNRLLEKSASNVPFLRLEYLLAWWKHMGGGEWTDGELFVITGWTEDGEKLVAAAPFFLTRNREEKPAVMLIGSIEISDYLDIVCEGKDYEEFWQSVLDTLEAENGLDWRLLDLYNVPDSSPSKTILKKLTGERGMTFSAEVYEPCPHIPLAGDWEEYLNSLDKRFRKNLERRIRVAENYHIPVEWYFVDDPEKLGAELDDFFAMMMQDPDKNKFLKPEMETQMREIVRTAFENGWLQFAVLTVGNNKAAGHLSFDFNNRIMGYNSSFDYSQISLSPGLVLTANLVKWAIENRKEEYDFMRGSESYKYDYGSVNREVLRIQVSRCCE